MTENVPVTSDTYKARDWRAGESVVDKSIIIRAELAEKWAKELATMMLNAGDMPITITLRVSCVGAMLVEQPKDNAQ